MKCGYLILGNQLFSPDFLKKVLPKGSIGFMREDLGLCTYYKFHKHKIIFFLTAMRKYAAELRDSGLVVHYQRISESQPNNYDSALELWLKENKIKKLFIFEIEDKFFELRILNILRRTDVQLEVMQSPMFLSSREDFSEFLATQKKPFMKTFYERQRKKFKILVDKHMQPEGGAWSYDSENRLPLPKSIQPPSVREDFAIYDAELDAVKKTVDSIFSSHPGESVHFWLPCGRTGARDWLKRFLKDRLKDFGPYEDAIPEHSEFLYHSVLSPFLNTGLLTPSEVISETLEYARKNAIPIASLEGFIRQIIGWREFVRGIYQNFSERQEQANFWRHHKKLTNSWYEGSTNVPPLDYAIKKILHYGYATHIERLMVIGSLMLLLEVDPKEAHKWFMEMFVDSSDWVMGPNVYGMALFSDGGIFATKPYLCGSNYYRKMGGYKQEAWCDGVDGLYWSFIEKHKTFFLKNPRLAMMARTVEKMDALKKERIYGAADRLRGLLVK